MVWIGSSLVEGGTFYGVNTRIGHGQATLAPMLTGQRLRLLHNAGIPGNNTEQMRSRFAADVFSRAPDIVVIGSPTNDSVIVDSTWETSKVNTLAMAEAAEAAGCAVAFDELWPRPGTNAIPPDKVNAWNKWLHALA